jgi:predicted RNA-binding protein Jag
VKRAQEAADKVRRWGEPVELEALGSFDRRIIHHTFKDDPDVETQSVEVDGTDRKMLLLRPRR